MVYPNKNKSSFYKPTMSGCKKSPRNNKIITLTKLTTIPKKARIGNVLLSCIKRFKKLSKLKE